MIIGHLDPWGEFLKTVIYSVPGSLDFQHRDESQRNPKKPKQSDSISWRSPKAPEIIKGP